MDAEAGRFEDRPHEGDGRTLAVGAGDMDHRRQLLLRIAQPLEQAQDAPERQVDQLGMQREEARQQEVGCAHADTGLPAGVEAVRQRRAAARVQGHSRPAAAAW